LKTTFYLITQNNGQECFVGFRMEKSGRGFEGFFSGGMWMNHKVDLKKHGFFECGCNEGVRSGKRYECRWPKCKSIANPSFMAIRKERDERNYRNGNKKIIEKQKCS